MVCLSDPQIVKKEDQFQEQSLSEEYMFCRHLIEVYSQLPRLSHLKCRIRWSVQEWILQKENQIFKVQYHPQTCDAGDGVVTDYFRKRLSLPNEKNRSQDRTLGDPPSQK